MRAREAALIDKARSLLDFVTLSHLEHQPARVLSGGQRKLLELARVLMADPDVILLDEPAAGVNPVLLEVIIERVTALNRQGVSILLIEHNMEMVSRLCSRVVAMALGKLLAEGSLRQTWRPSRRHRRLSRRRPVSDIVLSTKALVAGYEPDLPIVRGVDFEVRKGELVVLLGPNGAGKSTFVKAIAGLVPIHSGAMTLNGRDITRVAPHRKVAEGLGFVPQTENVFATMSILEKPANRGGASAAVPAQDGERGAVSAFLISPPSHPDCGALSGGQRQNARGRPRPGARSARHHSRRALGGPVAQDRRRGLFHAPQRERQRRDRDPGRTECEGRRSPSQAAP